MKLLIKDLNAWHRQRIRLKLGTGMWYVVRYILRNKTFIYPKDIDKVINTIIRSIEFSLAGRGEKRQYILDKSYEH